MDAVDGSSPSGGTAERVLRSSAAEQSLAQVRIRAETAGRPTNGSRRFAAHRTASTSYSPFVGASGARPRSRARHPSPRGPWPRPDRAGQRPGSRQRARSRRSLGRHGARSRAGGPVRGTGGARSARQRGGPRWPGGGPSPWPVQPGQRARDQVEQDQHPADESRRFRPIQLAAVDDRGQVLDRLD